MNKIAFVLSMVLAFFANVAAAAPVASEEAEGYRVTLSLDQDSYKHDIRYCITTPCPSKTATVHATLVVTNTTEAEKILSFPSAMLHDLEIVDERGDVVTSWGKDRMFMLAMTELTLSAGESRAFHMDVVLENDSGEPLVGSFEVIGSIKSLENAPRVNLNIAVSR